MSINQKIFFVVLFVFLTTIGFAQTERWVYIYSGDSLYHSDGAYSIAYGLDGNLYAGGYTWNSAGTNYGFTVISLTNSGSERWIYKYPTLDEPNGEVNAIVYGLDGNIYAAGVCLGSDSNHHFTIISLTTDGTERWVYQYPAISDANSICFGADGNIYAVGNTGLNILVVSVDTNGTENWHYIFNNPSSETDPGQSIVYGLDGNIYVTGWSGSPYTDATVISLTNSGLERWVYLYNGPGDIYDYAVCVIYGSDNNLYVFGETCYFWGPGYVFGRGLIISLTRSGTERWVYISPNDPSGLGRGMQDADGNLYGVGAYGWDIPFLLVESISDSGTYRWSYIDTTWGYARTIAYGNDGNIYAGGITTDSSYWGNDFFTVISFTPTGSHRWTYKFRRDGSPNYFNEAISVVYGLDENIYAAGKSGDSLTGGDFTVISLSSTGIQEDSLAKSLTREELKLKVLPNIISNNALFQYTIPKKQHISLNLFDIVGRKVATIAEGTVEPGIYSYNLDSSNLSSGVYFLILQGTNETKTEKVLIIR